MRARTPSTSAEMDLENYALVRRARLQGREPRRVVGEGYTPYALDGPLPVDHPLFDTPADLRRKRIERERERARRVSK